MDHNIRKQLAELLKVAGLNHKFLAQRRRELTQCPAYDIEKLLRTFDSQRKGFSTSVDIMNYLSTRYVVHSDEQFMFILQEISPQSTGSFSYQKLASFFGSTIPITWRIISQDVSPLEQSFQKAIISIFDQVISNYRRLYVCRRRLEMYGDPVSLFEHMLDQNNEDLTAEEVLEFIEQYCSMDSSTGQHLTKYLEPIGRLSYNIFCRLVTTSGSKQHKKKPYYENKLEETKEIKRCPSTETKTGIFSSSSKEHRLNRATKSNSMMRLKDFEDKIKTMQQQRLNQSNQRKNGYMTHIFQRTKASLCLRDSNMSAFMSPPEKPKDFSDYINHTSEIDKILDRKEQQISYEKNMRQQLQQQIVKSRQQINRLKHMLDEKQISKDHRQNQWELNRQAGKIKSFNLMKGEPRNRLVLRSDHDATIEAYKEDRAARRNRIEREVLTYQLKKDLSNTKPLRR